MIDGEILETLWSVLNDISRSTRTATLAHRMEVLDDHMGDSNWKKIIGTGNAAWLFLLNQITIFTYRSYDCSKI